MEDNSNQPNETQNNIENNEPKQEDNSNQSTIATEQHDPHHDSKRRKTLLILVVALLLIAFSCIAYLLTRDIESDNVSLTPITSAPVTTLGASIASVEGTVQTSQDSETWNEAVAGESLANLDYIRTLEDSRAIVLFDDGSVVRLSENTSIYLSSLQKDTSEITLEKGKVYNRVVASESRTYTVVTANERFEALGTAFTTSSEETKDEVEVFESDVEIASQKIVVSQGNKYDSESKELSAIDLDALQSDEFAQWNKQKDSEIEEFKDKLGVLAEKVAQEEESTSSAPRQDQSGGIVLSGAKSDKGASLSWTVSGLALKEGFKVVRDKNDATPSYGEHQALYVGDNATRKTLWHDDSGGTYYYRVCIYSSGSCANYSNSVRIESPLVKKEAVKTGTINLTLSGSKISWGLVGGNAPHGYKILLSQAQNPTYPEHSIKYVGADTTSVTLPEKSAGTYYVRICKYTNGTQDAGCVDYSNQVEYIVN